MHRQWKQGHAAWEVYRDAVWLFRDGIKKAKAQMELSLAKDAKNNKEGFCRYIGQKTKAKESVPPLINEKGEPVMTDVEKAEVLNFFALVYAASQASHVSCFPGHVGDGWGSKVPPRVSEEHLCAWDDHGTDSSGSNVKAHAGKGGDPRQSAWLHRGQIIESFGLEKTFKIIRSNHTLTTNVTQ